MFRTSLRNCVFSLLTLISTTCHHKKSLISPAFVCTLSPSSRCLVHFFNEGIPFFVYNFSNDEIPNHLKPTKEGLKAHANQTVFKPIAQPPHYIILHHFLPFNTKVIPIFSKEHQKTHPNSSRNHQHPHLSSLLSPNLLRNQRNCRNRPHQYSSLSMLFLHSNGTFCQEPLERS